MKRFFYVIPAVLLLSLSACNFQSPASNNPVTTRMAAAVSLMTCQQLDDKQYTITVTVGDKVDGTELLSFKNMHVESSQCLKYGFEATPFTCAPNSDGSVTFESLMKSEKEGEMQWKGIATENLVRGTVLWVKTGQENINYIFEGPRKD